MKFTDTERLDILCDEEMFDGWYDDDVHDIASKLDPDETMTEQDRYRLAYRELLDRVITKRRKVKP